jgi:hypothetical protein
LTVARLPSAVPDAPFNDRVVVLVCGNPYADGIYRLSALTIPEPGEPWAKPERPVGDLAAAVRDAGFLAVNLDCNRKLPPAAAALFHPPIARGSVRLYARRAEGATP